MMRSLLTNTDSRVILSVAAISVAVALTAVGLPGAPEPVSPPAVEVVAAEAPVLAKGPETPLIPAPGGMPFPVDIDVAFALTDHFGNDVTNESFRGKPMLLFFGYASCESICTVALPRMGQALDHLGADGDEIAAVMVTVDPERDTPKSMRSNLPRWHDRLVGLTGSDAALAGVRDRFQVNLEVVAHDPTGAPIYAHGSFVYLIGADGELKTMVPPILGPERIAELARKYF